MPYIYSEAMMSSVLSRPLLRPLYFEAPREDEAYKHLSTYLFGEGLLVSPICRAMDENGIVESEIWFPEGIWYDWFTGKRYESGLHKVTNTLSTFPLFVRAGYPIVTQPYTSRMATAALKEPRIIIYTGEDGNSLLYEDDGISQVDPMSEVANNRTMGIGYSYDSAHIISLSPTNTGYDDGVDLRDITVELRDCDEVSSVECDSHKVSLSYENRCAVIVVENVSTSCVDMIEVIVK